MVDGDPEIETLPLSATNLEANTEFHRWKKPPGENARKKVSLQPSLSRWTPSLFLRKALRVVRAPFAQLD
jgi:hypothetical protein